MIGIIGHQIGQQLTTHPQLIADQAQIAEVPMGGAQVRQRLLAPSGVELGQAQHLGSQTTQLRVL